VPIDDGVEPPAFFIPYIEDAEKAEKVWLGVKRFMEEEIIFDSEENARAAGDRISAVAADARDDVTLDSVEVREVVASA
jgi:hypothetical protein